MYCEAAAFVPRGSINKTGLISVAVFAYLRIRAVVPLAHSPGPEIYSGP